MTAIRAVASPPRTTEDAAVAAVLDAPLPDLTTGRGDPSHGLVLGPFLRPHLHGLHPYLVEVDVPTTLDVLAVLPAGSRVLRLHRRSEVTEVLAAHDGCLIVVRSWRRCADIWVSGANQASVDSLVELVRSAAPAPPGAAVLRVHFWHKVDGPWQRSRELAVPSWQEVCHLYPKAVRDALATLVGYQPPAVGPGGRLLLWHGPPGTGKTTAVRALFDEWRGWAAAHVVSDPEQLLNDGAYLAEVLLHEDDDDSAEPPWRLVVIEDADELLRRDAATTNSAALGRLLNTADGLLGQGLRVLILLTTNQLTGQLHPALLRPGRCLARIEFSPFGPEEAAALLGAPAAGSMTLAEIMEQTGALSRVEAVDRSPGPGLYL